jgi:hypothetical protein
MLTLSIDTARRFILGKQGLWPGRRWRGIKGTEQAMGAMEYLQLDRTVLFYAQWMTRHEWPHIKQIERTVNTVRM